MGIDIKYLRYHSVFSNKVCPHKLKKNQTFRNQKKKNRETSLKRLKNKVKFKKKVTKSPKNFMISFHCFVKAFKNLIHL